MMMKPVCVLLLCSFVASVTAASHGPCFGFSKCPSFPGPASLSPPNAYPSTYNYSGSFPDGFMWGLGSAAYQIEGAYNEDGRGASIWDTFTGADTVGMPGSVCASAPCPINDAMYAKGATGNVADNHYHNFEKDVALMASMKLPYYRFSISWPRLVPLGNASAPNAVNPSAVAFYNRLINALLAAGITPVVTLYHWDLPQALLQPPYDTPEKMGWFSSDAAGRPHGEAIVDLFASYCDVAFKEFGDRVKYWTTFNEAWTFTWLGSGGGKAPGLPEFSEMPKWGLVAGHNVLLAHAAAVKLYRADYAPTQAGKIFMTNNMDWREPRTTAQADVTACQRALEFQLGWFADPVFTGDYPESMRSILGDALPTFTPAQSADLKGSSDLFGLNSYGVAWGADSDDAGFSGAYCDTTETAGPDGPGFPRAQSIWLYGAGWAIRKLLNWISDRYDHPPVFVTEAGWSLEANSTANAVPDPDRILYFANYTSELQRAVAEDGVDLVGFSGWSLYDNFEWERGFTERFGVVYNDFKFGKDPNSPPGWAGTPTATGQVRTRKDSSRYLEAVWTTNQVTDPAPFLPNKKKKNKNEKKNVKKEEEEEEALPPSSWVEEA